jgi:hypothetical protein
VSKQWTIYVCPIHGLGESGARNNRCEKCVPGHQNSGVPLVVVPLSRAETAEKKQFEAEERAMEYARLTDEVRVKFMIAETENERLREALCRLQGND